MFPAQVYGSSKAALSSITCTLATKKTDIHVVVLNPGYNATSLNNFAGTVDPKERHQTNSAACIGKDGGNPWILWREWGRDALVGFAFRYQDHCINVPI